VGGLGVELGLVGGGGVVGDDSTEVAGGGVGDGGFGGSRKEVVLRAEGGGIDFDDGDGFGRAGLGAGGRFAIGEALVAHVALADDAAVVRIFGNIVGALEDAVSAADALVIEVANDAGVFFFFVGADGAAVQALGVEAVVAGGGDGLLKAITGFEEPDIAPGFIFIESVESVAGDDAGFAAGAFVELDLEGVLLSRAGFFEGDEVFVEVGTEFVVVVRFCEAGDRGLKDRLFLEEFVDEVIHDDVEEALSLF